LAASLRFCLHPMYFLCAAAHKRYKALPWLQAADSISRQRSLWHRAESLS
jgi:hypothetical protein